jgi:ribonuclease P protein component
MLAGKNILTGKANFERVEKEGKLFQFESFGISVFTRNDRKPSCFGFIVSTKISKDSVQRNRIKRALKEAVRRSMIDIAPGLDVVFLGKPISARKSTDILMLETKAALPESGIFK